MYIYIHMWKSWSMGLSCDRKPGLQPFDQKMSLPSSTNGWLWPWLFFGLGRLDLTTSKSVIVSPMLGQDAVTSDPETAVNTLMTVLNSAQAEQPRVVHGSTWYCSTVSRWDLWTFETYESCEPVREWSGTVAKSIKSIQISHPNEISFVWIGHATR